MDDPSGSAAGMHEQDGGSTEQVLGTPALAAHIAASISDARSADSFLSCCRAAWGAGQDPRLLTWWARRGWRPFTQAVQRWEQAGDDTHAMPGVLLLPAAHDTTGGAHWVVSAGLDNSVRLWSLAHGVCAGQGRGHAGDIKSMAACAWDGGALLASGSDDLTVLLQRADTALAAGAAAAATAAAGAHPFATEAPALLESCEQLDDFEGAVLSLAFAQPGPPGRPPQLLATGGDYREPYIKLWALGHRPDGSTGCARTGAEEGTEEGAEQGAAARPRAVLKAHQQGVSGLGFSPLEPGRLVSGSFDETLRCWDIATQRCSLQLGVGSSIYDLALTEDGRLACVSYVDGSLQAWDLASGASVAHLRGHEDAGWAIAALGGSSGRVQLASASHDKTARLWDLRRAGGGSGAEGRGACTAVVPHPDSIFSIAFGTGARPSQAGGGVAVGGGSGVQLVTACNDCRLRAFDLSI